jgi:hypothetical protein
MALEIRLRGTLEVLRDGRPLLLPPSKKIAVDGVAADAAIRAGSFCWPGAPRH